MNHSKLIGKWHAGIFLGAAILLWLVPFFWSGWRGSGVALFPEAMRFQHSAAGLFTKATGQWWDHHMEAEDVKGQRFELDEWALFPMGAFGFRTRYDRIMNETNRNALVVQVRKRLVEHVIKRMGNLQERGVSIMPKHLAGSAAPSVLKSIRIVRSLWNVGSVPMVLPEGAWNPPPITEIALKNRLVLGSYRIRNGTVIDISAKRASVYANGSSGQARPRTPGPSIKARDGSVPVMRASDPASLATPKGADVAYRGSGTASQVQGGTNLTSTAPSIRKLPQVPAAPYQPPPPPYSKKRTLVLPPPAQQPSAEVLPLTRPPDLPLPSAAKTGDQ